MKILSTLILGVYAAWIWWSVGKAVATGVVMRPKGGAMWREARYYDRDEEPIRFWLNCIIWTAAGIFVTTACVYFARRIGG